MKGLTNPFSKPTQQESDNEILKKIKFDNEMKELKAMAGDMLIDQRYLKFREATQNICNSALRELLVYNAPDNNTYATNVKALLAKINCLIAFLDTPVDFLNAVSAQRGAL